MLLALVLEGQPQLFVVAVQLEGTAGPGVSQPLGTNLGEGEAENRL